MRDFAQAATPNKTNTKQRFTTADDVRTLKLLLPYLKKYRFRIFFALVFLFLAKIAVIAVPLILKEIIDALSLSLDSSEAITRTIITLPLALIITYGVLRLCSVIFQEIRNAIFAKAGQQSTREISLKIFEHLHKLSLRFHLDRRTGGLSRDIERGSRSISIIYRYLLFSLVPTLFEIMVVCGILFYKFGWFFALITLTTIVAYSVFTFYITQWRTKFRLAMNEADSSANTVAIDALINYETVKYFANEKHEYQRYDKHIAEWQKQSIKSELSLSVLNVGQGIIISTGVTVLLILAASRVVTGEYTAGDWAMVSAFMLQLFIPLNFLGTLFREIKRSLIDISKMFTLMDEDPEIKEHSNAAENVNFKKDIEFDEVTFSYNPERQILNGISFSIPSGKTVAVVGASGAGKSTIARLLFRFYDASSGAIRIDGTDIRDLSLNELHSAIGIVPQDTVLFNDTLLYNIQYGRPEAELYEVIKAIKMANLEHLVEQSPQGLETIVGERGLKLSGGEKQRVAIARTILKNPKILILDEATSSLDSKTERDIQNALSSVSANRTTLVIAHRLSTIVDADNIVVLDKGKVVETGNHEELLQLDKVYAKLWQIQQSQAH